MSQLFRVGQIYIDVGDSAPRGCTEDEGKSLEVGLQEPDELGDLPPDLRGPGGEITPICPTPVIGFQSGCSY
jgi:hypothetical protein